MQSNDVFNPHYFRFNNEVCTLPSQANIPGFEFGTVFQETRFVPQRFIPPPHHDAPTQHYSNPPHIPPSHFPPSFNHLGSSTLPVTSSGPHLPTKPTVKRSKRLTTNQRFATLSHDNFVVWFSETQVLCSGCTKIIQMDSRKGAKYYSQAWRKHKQGCKGVEEGIVSNLYAFQNMLIIDLWHQTAEKWRAKTYETSTFYW